MKYITILAIVATAFAAPALENQMIMDTPATYNEHDGSSPHVEVNVYLNGEAPVSDTSSAFRCYYCGNQATNDQRTTTVCKTAGGKVKPCGSKQDGVGCTDSKFTKDQFARECGMVGCISSADTCSASSKPKDREEAPVSDTNDHGRRCYDCGSQTLDDLRTNAVCGKSSGDTRLCGSKGPISCVSSKLNDEQFGKECGMVGCISATKSCPSKAISQEETSLFDQPIEVKVYVNEL